MKKYKVYINSGYLYFSDQASALKIAKEMLDKGINIDIKSEEVEDPTKTKT